LGIEAPAKANRTLQFGHVEVIVDDNFSAPSQDESTSTSASASSLSDGSSSLSDGYGYQQSSTETTEPTPDQGKPIGGGGVPCVN
ncbi:MAG: LytR family transcriptional regulator, partial [Mycobacterium sp.]